MSADEERAVIETTGDLLELLSGQPVAAAPPRRSSAPRLRLRHQQRRGRTGAAHARTTRQRIADRTGDQLRPAVDVGAGLARQDAGLRRGVPRGSSAEPAVAHPVPGEEAPGSDARRCASSSAAGRLRIWPTRRQQPLTAAGASHVAASLHRNAKVSRRSGARRCSSGIAGRRRHRAQPDKLGCVRLKRQPQMFPA